MECLVRQEGQTPEVLNSVERTWRYWIALAKRMRHPMPEAENYWRPGVLLDQLARQKTREPG